MRLKMDSFIPICMLHRPRGPDFIFVLSTSQFWVRANFCEKCTEWPQNDLDMFKVKSTHMHTTHTLEAQIFIRIALPWAVFELQPNFVKSIPNYLKMTLTHSTSKILVCMVHKISEVQTFIHFGFCSTMIRFWVSPFFLGGGDRAEWPCHVHGQKCQYACYIDPP